MNTFYLGLVVAYIAVTGHAQMTSGGSKYQPTFLRKIFFRVGNYMLNFYRGWQGPVTEGFYHQYRARLSVLQRHLARLLYCCSLNLTFFSDNGRVEIQSQTSPF